jgi:hypothetical protein
VPWQDVTQVVNEDVYQSKSWTDASASSDDLESGPLEEATVASQGEVLIVIWIAMIDLKERCSGKESAARPENPFHFFRRLSGELEVFENRLAMDGVHRGVCVRQSIGVSDDINVGKRIEVDVDESRMGSGGAAADRYAKSLVRQSLEKRVEGAMGSGRAHVAYPAHQPPVKAARE